MVPAGFLGGRDHPLAIRSLARLLMVSAAVIVAAAVLQKPFLQSLLPAVNLLINIFDTTYRTIDLRLQQPGARLLVERVVTLESITVVGTTVLYPDPRGLAVVSTPAAGVIQPVVIAVAIWLAAPGLSLARVVLGLPLLMLVLAADLPLLLTALPWEIHVAAHEPNRLSPVLLWREFLLSGGRLFLGVLAGTVPLLLQRPRYASAGASTVTQGSSQRAGATPTA